jgi:3-dehydroquinate dehydratase
MNRSLNYTGLNEEAIMGNEMSKDVEEAIEYVISNFELAEVDIIQETLANHIADWIEKTNRQWEH